MFPQNMLKNKTENENQYKTKKALPSGRGLIINIWRLNGVYPMIQYVLNWAYTVVNSVIEQP